MLELGYETLSSHTSDTIGADKVPGSTVAPDSIGRYRILRVIGQGGMGVVYEAEQDQPRRTVALKIIKPGMATPELLRRFEQESQALGRLQHPGIAQIYEAGTVDTGFGPQPYFAMEFIRGQAPREYAEAKHLTTRQRLEIMVKICDAVHHAHQRGLIHRDLKPGNILVDDTGQPKILDFGVARVTDSDTRSTQQTDIGQLIGTLAYMSPEQALADPMDIDTRSDVYALGVILYELLTGRLPYTISKKLHETILAIREEDPAKLSSVNRTYRGDIETIVGKALEKDRTRRYASAAGMAADIQRHLRDEPIAARPPSASYQLQKFTRRHKSLVAGMAAVFVVLFGAVLVLTWEATVIRRERDQAILAGNQRDQALIAAVADRNLAREAEAKAREEGDLKTVSDRRALAAEKLSDLAKIAAEAAQFVAQGNYPAAEELYVKLLAAERIEFGIDDPITLSHMIALASVYASPRLPLSQRKYAAAEKLSKEIFERQSRTLGDDAPGTLESMSNLAELYSLQHKYADAERLWTRVVEERTRVLGEESALTMTSMISLGDTYRAMGNSRQANAVVQTVTQIARRLVDRNDPLGQQILNTLPPDLSGASNLREQMSPTRNTVVVSEADGGCKCTTAVIVSDTRGYDFGNYLNKAIASIRNAWTPLIPEAARSRSHRVVFRFTISSDGALQEMHLVTSSGAEDTDHPASSAIQSASPFARLPAEFKGDRIDVQLTFSYTGTVQVSGHVIAEGGDGRVPMFSLSFVGAQVRATTKVQPNGQFRISVPLGEYRITPSAIPAGFYLKSIRMGSTDLSETPLKIEESAPVEIVVTLGAEHP
jgi:non-specific serine/threonine protein kinase/serine/threonine-protein kinase